MKSHTRNGLSILEVLLALAILGVSLAAIGTVVSSAYRNARRAEMRSDANLICDTKLAEFAAGAFGKPTSIGSTPVPEDPEWQFEVNVENSQIPGLLRATVIVGRTQNTEQNVMVMATRFIPDPDYDPTDPAYQ
ncbi:MAG: prepilin-type N-terminal cleavage/methylation domain-containing protein [Planctomycetota bacterium]